MTTNRGRITLAGQMLADAWISDTTIDAMPETLFPRNVEDAIAIQDETARLIGEEIVGWKVGGAPGPMVGRIYASRRHASAAKLPLRQFPSSRIECEIGFRLLHDLPARSQAYGRDEVLRTAVLAFTIEFTGSRFTNGKHTPDTDKELLAIVADNAAGAGLVTGPEVVDWRHLSLLDIPVVLRINGRPPSPPNPREKRTDPAEILVWLANDLSRRAIGLRAGQWVTTGSTTVPGPFEPGDSAVVSYGDFGQIAVSLAAS